MLSKILAGIIIAGALGGWFFFNYASDQIAMLNKNNATLSANQKVLEEINSTNTKTIEEMVVAQAEVAKKYEETLEEFQVIRMQRDELISKFARHDLSYLALMKPELVERIINSASKDAARCFELISGAPKTQREISAKTANEFNSECPFYWSGYGE